MPENPPIFRPARDSDFHALFALINLAFSVEKGDFKVQERLTAQELEEYRARGRFIVAQPASEDANNTGSEAGTLLACVYVEIPDLPKNSFGNGAAYFGLLSVDPAHQRQGLGRAMTGQAEKIAIAMGCNLIELDILDRRPELLPIYQSMGYRVVSTRPAPQPERFTKPVQFVRMRKILLPQ